MVPSDMRNSLEGAALPAVAHYLTVSSAFGSAGGASDLPAFGVADGSGLLLALEKQRQPRPGTAHAALHRAHRNAADLRGFLIGEPDAPTRMIASR